VSRTIIIGGGIVGSCTAYFLATAKSSFWRRTRPISSRPQRIASLLAPADRVGDVNYQADRIRKDRSIFAAHVHHMSIPPSVRGTGGGLLYRMGTMQDLSTERRLEFRLNQTRRLEVVGRLTAGIAHDFKHLCKDHGRSGIGG
jgi:hypothetical protein